MSNYINVERFHQPLKAAGLIPDNCRVLKMTIGVRGALTIRYEIFVTAQQLLDLGVIFQDVGRATIDASNAKQAESGPSVEVG